MVRRTLHPKFDPTEVQTHDLWIMNETFHVTETLDWAIQDVLKEMNSNIILQVWNDHTSTVLKLFLYSQWVTYK